MVIFFLWIALFLFFGEQGTVLKNLALGRILIFHVRPWRNLWVVTDWFLPSDLLQWCQFFPWVTAMNGDDLLFDGQKFQGASLGTFNLCKIATQAHRSVAWFCFVSFWMFRPASGYQLGSRAAAVLVRQPVEHAIKYCAHRKMHCVLHARAPLLYGYSNKDFHFCLFRDNIISSWKSSNFPFAPAFLSADDDA